MYQKHPEFEEPPDDAIIWRYLDFTKFVSYLEKQSIFFIRADKLGDKFEGKYTQTNAKKWKEMLEKIDNEKIEEFDQAKIYNAFRMHVKINGWHMSEHESAAMWKLYLKGDEGIAIKSSFKRLRESFNGHKEDEILIGMIKYIDYLKDVIKEGNIFNPFLFKRKSFEHEKELRAVILRLPPQEETEEKHILYVEPKNNGIYVSTNLDILIDKIVISPTAENWFKEVVDSVLKKYGLKKDVIRSDISKDPIY